ncbi:hypothetical protein P6O24_00540 [Clostridium perfringens]|uniref:hypothetical protein n=1 Tax=Clostridium perfringens TaxID=1502 RepID=UPI0022481CA1|nr:hypothetical protein [Clostridium perfringens]MCX0388635.1 hypothetical protein [Clostridium perfringens]MDK0557584.1 hypothetical protein [Clostridium perfringens]
MKEKTALGQIISITLVKGFVEALENSVNRNEVITACEKYGKTWALESMNLLLQGFTKIKRNSISWYYLNENKELKTVTFDTIKGIVIDTNDLGDIMYVEDLEELTVNLAYKVAPSLLKKIVYKIFRHGLENSSLQFENMRRIQEYFNLTDSEILTLVRSIRFYNNNNEFTLVIGKEIEKFYILEENNKENLSVLEDDFNYDRFEILDNVEIPMYNYDDELVCMFSILTNLTGSNFAKNLDLILNALGIELEDLNIMLEFLKVSDGIYNKYIIYKGNRVECVKELDCWKPKTPFKTTFDGYVSVIPMEYMYEYFLGVANAILQREFKKAGISQN